MLFFCKIHRKRVMKKIIQLTQLTILISQIFLVGCSAKNAEDDNDDNIEIIDPLKAQQEMEHKDTIYPKSIYQFTSNAIKLTPEQIKQQLTDSTGYQPSEEGKWLFNIFNTQLGGIDYKAHTKRSEALTTDMMQTLNLIAFSFAKHVVVSEYSKSKSNRSLLNIVDLENSLPTSAESLAKWTEQVNEIYWRLFSRPPQDYEISQIKLFFMDSYDFDYSEYDLKRSHIDKINKSWILTLTVLFSSMEFWNV